MYASGLCGRNIVEVSTKRFKQIMLYMSKELYRLTNRNYTFMSRYHLFILTVGNIPYEASEEQLKEIFSEVGPVVSFRSVYMPYTVLNQVMIQISISCSLERKLI